MSSYLRTAVGLVLALGLVLAHGAEVRGQASGASPPAGSTANLTLEQQALLKDFESFEKHLAELGEALRASDLDRANLLFQARSESQRQQIQARMAEVVAILNEKRPFADAVERQKLVVEQLQAILRILQSDAERDRLQTRIKELEGVLKETNRVIGAQKDVRADTERGGGFDKLQGDQQRVREAAENLANKIDQQDRARAGESGQPNGSPTPDQPAPMPGEQPPMPGESPPMPGEPMPSEPTPTPGQPSPSQPSPSQPSPGQPSPGQQPSQGQPPSATGRQPQQAERTPGREELEQALREMQQALDELRQQNRDAASNEQDQAIAQLEQLKARIEEILRQLRKEERELQLTMLEARFQEMLKLQLRINADTVRLDARDPAERGEAHFTKSRDLGRQEQQNVLAAEKALALLKEEGSSVAFPEAVDQMRSNLQVTADRLVKGDTGATTQLLEKLIVETLEEMILALQKELEKSKNDQQQGPPQRGEPSDPRLVETLAELKMIRSLQSQVNRLTRQIGLEIEGEQTQNADQLRLLEDLSRRQSRIQSATYDLATGRNE